MARTRQREKMIMKRERPDIASGEKNNLEKWKKRKIIGPRKKGTVTGRN